MKRIFYLLLSILGIYTITLSACGNPETEKKSAVSNAEDSPATPPPAQEVDSKKGIGKFNESNVQISDKLDGAMADNGDKIYNVKCSSCHKLTDERLVGPGWKGVTQRRTPYWVMNFITNVEEMLNKDAEAQAQLEVCLVRMPNQSLTDQDARAIFEFMRKNDGIK